LYNIGYIDIKVRIIWIDKINHIQGKINKGRKEINQARSQDLEVEVETKKIKRKINKKYNGNQLNHFLSNVNYKDKQYNKYLTQFQLGLGLVFQMMSTLHKILLSLNTLQ
jgi:hypothetical protein